MRIPGRSFYILGLVLLAFGLPMQSYAQQKRVEVQLSSNRVSVDESVVMVVRAFSLDEELNASALDANFDVTKRSSSREVRIENGRRTSVVEWVLELVPKRTGALEVAPVTVGSEQSRPLTLLVEDAASGSARELYVEASVDNREPYVQSQVIYTLRVFQDVRFLDASLSMPTIADAVFQQIGEERNYQETVDGRDYRVSEIRYTVFPQKSGKVLIPSIVLKAVVAVNRSQVPNTRTRTRTLSRRADDIELNVKARPDGLLGNWWLPAKEVSIESEWSEPVENMSVDQPITRSIKIVAQGVADSQLPRLEVPKPEGISIYADSPTASTQANQNGLVSQQINTWAVIPQKAGELVLPEVRINWFDIEAGEARVAVLPEQRLMVAPAGGVNNNRAENSAAAGSNNGTAQSNALQDNANALTDSQSENDVIDSSAESSVNTLNDSTTTSALVNQSDLDVGTTVDSSEHGLLLTQAIDKQNLWRNTAFGLLAGWLLSLIGLAMWWRSKRSPKPHDDQGAASVSETELARFKRQAGSKAALEPIKLACESADASKISQQVLAWGTMVWPNSPPRHISDVGNRLNHQPLSEMLEAVDAQQYRANGGVNTVAFDAIPSLLKTAVERHQDIELAASNAYGLPSL